MIYTHAVFDHKKSAQVKQQLQISNTEYQIHSNIYVKSEMLNFLFQTGLNLAYTDLELTWEPRLASNSQRSSYVILPSAMKTISMNHHA